MKKVAFVHDWLTGMRGGELVLEALIQDFPEAPIFTLISFPETLSPVLRNRKIITSWLQNLPGIQSRYRHTLPLMPRAIESFDLSDFDVIISSSHCVAKGIRKKKGAFHISYVHAPMRYIWDRFDDYFSPGRTGPLTRFAAKALRPQLQKWDIQSSRSVDAFVANSQFIAHQVERLYGKPCSVIHPFAALDRFKSLPRKPEPFYLMVGAFAPYKRVDLAIQACNHLGLQLKIVGSGQEETRLRALAGPTIEFLGPRTNEEIASLFSRCKALLFTGVEDFGITPIEALASGAPIVALAQGGALETLTDQTGVFFQEGSIESIIDALQRFESGPAPSEEACRERASVFSRDQFLSQWRRFLEKTLPRV